MRFADLNDENNYIQLGDSKLIDLTYQKIK